MKLRHIFISVLFALFYLGCGSSDSYSVQTNTGLRPTNPSSSADNTYPIASVAPSKEALPSDIGVVAGSDYEDDSFGIEASNAYEENYAEVSESGFVSATSNPLSTFSIDVDTASYSNIRRHLNNGSLPPKDAVRIEEMINYFDYDLPNDTDTIKIFSEVGTPLWNNENRLVQILLKAKDIDPLLLPGSNLTFLIDVSGSMSDDLDIVRSSLSLLILNLTKQDFVSIVTYAGSANLLLPSTRVTQANRSKIIKEIENIEFSGGTAGERGIEIAYAQAKESFITDGNNRVVMVTDGDFNVGYTQTKDLGDFIASKAKDNIFLTIAGVGTGNYRDDLIESLTNQGNGNYFYLDSLTEAKKVFSQDLTATLHTIAKDTKVQIEFNNDLVAKYRLIGYENRRLAKEDFADDTKDAGEMGVGDEVVAFYELELQPNSSNDGKLLTVNVRYKETTGTTSKALSEDVYLTNHNASDEFTFGMCVVAFGMKLGESRYTNHEYVDIVTLAKGAKGDDVFGYREEFIELVEKATKY